MSDETFTVFVDTTDGEVSGYEYKAASREAMIYLTDVLKAAGANFSNVLVSTVQTNTVVLTGAELRGELQHGNRSICKRCDLEIEYVGNARCWYDRGGNKTCSSGKQFHAPVSE